MYKFKNGLGYFNEDLPVWEYGKNKGRINRKAMVNMSLSGIYNNIEFNNITISDYLLTKNNNRSNTKFRINYKCRDSIISCERFLDGSLGEILNLITKDFKHEIGDLFRDLKRDISITDREYRIKERNPDKKGRVYKVDEKWYKYTCNVCGWTEGWIDEGNLKKGNGCSCCSGDTVVPHINSIKAKAPWMIDLGVSEEDAVKYTSCSNKKIKVLCPDCYTEKIVMINNVYKKKSISCSCGDSKSYITKYVMSILNQISYNYEIEVKHDWCFYLNSLKDKISYGIYDFVIEDIKLIIETDGEFHRKDNNMSGQSKEQSKFIDKEKDKLAKENGYKVVRISDEGNIKNNILNSDMIELFDLSKVDWLKCEEFALKNIAKEVCCYWNKKNEWETTKDLEKVFKLNKTTLSKYLKSGAKLGWCNYDPVEEKLKVSKRFNRTGSEVEVFDSLKKSQGIFISISELCRKSYDLFGVEFSTTNVSAVCRGVQKSHRGYTFKYVC